MANDLKLDALPPFETRTLIEKRHALETFRRPFSGYLGGIHRGGYWVERLSDEWSSTFRCRHSIPCNSATSGLLAACLAAGIGPGDTVWAPVYTMSATASCAKVLGANVELVDIETEFFSMDIFSPVGARTLPKAIIITNLFGHPAHRLKEIRAICDVEGIILIEDNAQSPFAKVGHDYTGAIGHIGVFSLNVHKHLQTGEGGVVVTNSDSLALKIKDAINHGELRGGSAGLNLRMTEPIAAIACAQLRKADSIIESRRELGFALTEMVQGIQQIVPPAEGVGCKHVFYIWAARVYGWEREKFVTKLNRANLPMNGGYSPPLNRVFQLNHSFPEAEHIEDVEIITFDVCSYSPKKRQLKVMKNIIHKAAESLK